MNGGVMNSNAVGNGGSGGNAGSNSSFTNNPFALQEELMNEPARLGLMFSNTIFEAHTRTVLLTSDQIHLAWRTGIDQAKLFAYRNMSQEDLWLSAAQKLTNIIKQIIEFAKLIPGFLKLTQEDQIYLLKRAAFEIAIVRMSRYFDVSQNAVLFHDTMLPMDAFMTTRDTVEMRLVTQIFDFAKNLAEMQLSETVLALYSAYILLQDERPGLRNVVDIKRLNETVLAQLQRELIQNPPPKVALKGDVSVLDKLLTKRHALKEISYLHMEALNRFKTNTSGTLVFPELHRELFPPC